MAFGGFNDSKQSAPMAEINVTPMVDVMLVLLVIFIITAPLFTHAVKLDLPTAQSAPAAEKPDTVTISINDAGAIYWNNDAVTLPALKARMATSAALSPQPELHLRADKSTRYDFIAQVMAAAQASGMSKIGFVTDATVPAEGK